MDGTQQMGGAQPEEQAGAGKPVETTPEAGGKTFTQDDVNRIVQERLAKEREKASVKPDAVALAEREKALAAREAELSASELARKWECDPEALKGFSREEICTISKGLDALGFTPNPNRLPGPAPAGNIPRDGDAVRQAMGLQR